MTDTIGPQFVRAAAGTDPRGWLVFESLPTDLSRAEDATQAADRERNCWARLSEKPHRPNGCCLKTSAMSCPRN